MLPADVPVLSEQMEQCQKRASVLCGREFSYSFGASSLDAPGSTKKRPKILNNNARERLRRIAARIAKAAGAGRLLPKQQQPKQDETDE